MRFASVVAHEIRNPLSAVKIALQTIQRQAQLTGPHERRLDIALREVGTIEDVLSRVLDWARPPPVTLAAVPARELVLDAVALCAADLAGRPTDLAASVDSHPTPVTADRVRVASALSELLRNAAQAGSEGRVRVGCTPAEGALHFTIGDEGTGFTDEARERAFEPFFTTRARGVGLGLARARAIARAHGGDIVIGRPKSGAEVTLWLPTGVAA